MLKKIVLPVFFLISFHSVYAQTADYIFYNGQVYMADADNHFFDAIAVKDSLILAVGTNSSMLAYQGAQTRLLNLNGRLITPGMIDAHNHMITAGETKILSLCLLPPEVSTISDLKNKVAEEATRKPEGEWIWGHGFFNLSDGRMPNKSDLDEVAPNHPVYLIHISGHMAVANSLALELAGITAESENPPGGIIEKDSITGEPTGILFNHYAMVLVHRLLPKFTVDEYMETLTPLMDQYIQEGISCIHDVNVGMFTKLLAYKKADSLGLMKIRVNIYLTCETADQVYHALDLFSQDSSRYETSMVKFCGFKLLLDGYAPMAYCYEPTDGFTWDLGTWHQDTLNKVTRMIHEEDYQITMHCMGDRSIDMAINAYEYALSSYPKEDHRHRLEHCMIPSDDAIARIKEMGLVVSFQPGALYFSGNSYRKIFAGYRIDRLMPIGTLMDLGIPLAFGSDYPTEPDVKPQLALHEALVRKSASGEEINVNESINKFAALKIHTIGSAYAAFDEDSLGTLLPGKYADLAIWSKNYFTEPVINIRNIEFDGMMIGGVLYNLNATSVKQTETIDFSNELIVYPNPVHDYLSIEFPLEVQEIKSIRLLSMDGKTHTELTAFEKTFQNTIILQTGNLSNGLYILKAITNQQEFTKRIIIQ